MPPNQDPKNGIHYGVIPFNDLFNCGEKFFDNAINKTYQAKIDNIKLAVKNAFGDNLGKEAIDSIMATLTANLDKYESDNNTYRYECEDYIIEGDGDDTNLFVIKSPYYTMTRPCSPCAPNAGDLRTANMKTGHLMTYCLDETWFEDEKCPYKYKKVK